MKLPLLIASTLGVAACSSQDGTNSTGTTSMTTGSATTASTNSASAATTPPDKPFRIVDRRWQGWGDQGPYLPAELPIPVRRKGTVQLAYFEIYGRWALPKETKEEALRENDKVTPPLLVSYGDPFTGAPIDRVQIDWRDERPGNPKAHFGIAASAIRGEQPRDFPTAPVIGHFSDPKWLPKDRLEILRKRIYEGLDILIHFYADEARTWTEDANKAAREVRDFFPIASEPGLWPYYRAEGKDFFAWLDKNAPPGKATLPWNSPSP